MSLALIVDGDAEKIAFPRQFYTEPTIRRGLNGNRVTLDQIAKNTCNLVASLAAKGCTKFILIVDREDRADDAEAVERSLQTKISILTTLPVQVVVADKMFENLLLADIENIAVSYPETFVICQNSLDHESTHGKSVFKSFMKSGVVYRVSDVAQYFNKVRTASAIGNSRSYRRWIDAITALGVPYIRRP